MTTLHTDPVQTDQRHADRSSATEPGAVRRRGGGPIYLDAGSAVRRAVVLLLAAGLVIGAVQPLGPLDYYWNPVIIGAAFALASLAGGRGSPLMGAGLVVFGFGLDRAIIRNFSFTGDFALTLGLIGVAALVAYGLHYVGWPSTVLTIGAALVFVALGQFIHGTFDLWVTPYNCMLTGLYGLAELSHAVRAKRTGQYARGDREPYPATV